MTAPKSAPAICVADCNTGKVSYRPATPAELDGLALAARQAADVAARAAPDPARLALIDALRSGKASPAELQAAVGQLLAERSGVASPPA